MQITDTSKQFLKSFLGLYSLVVIALIPLLFIELPFDTFSRSITVFWDWGHILFFALFVRIFAGSNLGSRKLSSQWRKDAVFSVVMIFSTLTIGTCIEIAQSGLSGRTSSWEDVLRDLYGGIIGLAWVHRKHAPDKVRRGLLMTATLLVVINLIPLYNALKDEYRAKTDFPILSSFETKAELSRWESDSKIERVKYPVRFGRYSLCLHLTTELYSGAWLKHFPHNWQGMKGLRISIFVPDSSELKLTFRIDDSIHAQSQQLYEDRFNRTVTLQPGWNAIFFSIDEIINAPRYRKMDIEHIVNFGLFSCNLQQDKLIYLDDLRLVKNSDQSLPNKPPL